MFIAKRDRRKHVEYPDKGRWCFRGRLVLVGCPVCGYHIPLDTPHLIDHGGFTRLPVTCPVVRCPFCKRVHLDGYHLEHHHYHINACQGE